MKAKCFKYYIINSVIAIAMTLFFSCNNNRKSVGNLDILANAPAGIADTLNLKYTDSMVLKANLLSPKMYDYSNRNFSFTEFPEGVVLHIYDGAHKHTVYADYAITYKDTDIIDLKGNVVIAMATKDTLFTEQLYYNQDKDWLFNNEKFSFRSKDYVTNGVGFDSDKTFNKVEILDFRGEFAVAED